MLLLQNYGPAGAGPARRLTGTGSPADIRVHIEFQQVLKP